MYIGLLHKYFSYKANYSGSLQLQAVNWLHKFYNFVHKVYGIKIVHQTGNLLYLIVIVPSKHYCHFNFCFPIQVRNKTPKAKTTMTIKKHPREMKKF